MDIFFLSILLQRWRRLFIGKRISISHVKYLLFLEFCTKKNIYTRAFLGVGGTGDGRVGKGGGGSAFFSISSQMTRINFYQNSGKQVEYMIFFLILHRPNHITYPVSQKTVYIYHVAKREGNSKHIA